MLEDATAPADRELSPGGGFRFAPPRRGAEVPARAPFTAGLPGRSVDPAVSLRFRFGRRPDFLRGSALGFNRGNISE